MIISNKYVTIEFHNTPKSISKFLEQLESKLEKFRTYFDLKEILLLVFCHLEIKMLINNLGIKTTLLMFLLFHQSQPKRLLDKCHGEVLICAEILIQESLEQGRS